MLQKIGGKRDMPNVKPDACSVLVLVLAFVLSEPRAASSLVASLMTRLEHQVRAEQSYFQSVYVDFLVCTL